MPLRRTTPIPRLPISRPRTATSRQNWKPDPAIQEQIKAKMKNPKVKHAVKQARESQKEQQQQQQPEQQPEKKEEKETPKAGKEIFEEGTFAISTFSTSSPSGEIYALHDSFMLDSASTVHMQQSGQISDITGSRRR